MAELQTEKNDKLEYLLEKFSQQIINCLVQGRENGTPPKKNMERYICGCQGAKDISNAIVVPDHQLQGDVHNRDLLNVMYRKTKNSQYK